MSHECGSFGQQISVAPTTGFTLVGQFFARKLRKGLTRRANGEQQGDARDLASVCRNEFVKGREQCFLLPRRIPPAPWENVIRQEEGLEAIERFIPVVTDVGGEATLVFVDPRDHIAASIDETPRRPARTAEKINGQEAR